MGCDVSQHVNNSMISRLDIFVCCVMYDPAVKQWNSCSTSHQAVNDEIVAVADFFVGNFLLHKRVPNILLNLFFEFS